MSSESHIYYGFSLTEKFREIEDAISGILEDESFDLRDFIWEHKIGQTHYDGGGWGQVTYFGVDIPQTDRGFVVTDEIIAEVKAMVANLDPNFRKALIEVFGEVPETAFDYEQSDG